MGSKSLVKDIAYLEAGVPELKDYLLSDELFWPLSARGVELPRLTVGGLLLVQMRLEAGGDQIETLRSQLERIRLKWRVAWEKKAGREIQARIRIWGNYLADYRKNPEEFIDAYSFEVRNRVMLQLLFPQVSAFREQKQALSDLDSLLRRNFSPNGFIWEMHLQDRFTREVYWYLYGRLRG
jgi:hypothetical protein